MSHEKRKVFQFRLPPNDLEKLCSIADECGLSRSDVIRRCVTIAGPALVATMTGITTNVFSFPGSGQGVDVRPTQRPIKGQGIKAKEKQLK